jgi:hypothetical protein
MINLTSVAVSSPKKKNNLRWLLLTLRSALVPSPEDNKPALYMCLLWTCSIIRHFKKKRFQCFWLSAAVVHRNHQKIINPHNSCVCCESVPSSGTRKKGSISSVPAFYLGLCYITPVHFITFLTFTLTCIIQCCWLSLLLALYSVVDFHFDLHYTVLLTFTLTCATQHRVIMSAVSMDRSRTDSIIYDDTDNVFR